MTSAILMAFWLAAGAPEGGVTAVHVAEAVRWLEAGRADLAADVFARYLARTPHERRVRRLLGDALLRAGRWDEARRAYERVLAARGDDAEAEAARRGLEAARARGQRDDETAFRQRVDRAGSAAEALEAARDAVATLGDRGGFRVVLARLALGANRFEEATTQLRATVRCGARETAEVAALRARVEAHRRDLAKRARAGDLDAALDLSRLLAADGATAEAVTLYRRLAEARPGHVGVRRRLAELLFADGRASEVQGVLDALVRAHPADLVLRLERARLLAWTEDYPRARAELASLEAEAPGDAGVALLRAWIDLWTGDEAAALRGFRAAPSPAPDVADQIAVLEGRHEEVLRRWEREHRLNPADRARALALADLLTRMGRYDEALAYATPGHDRRARLVHARALVAGRRYADGIAALKALDDAALQPELGRAYLAAGDYDAARAIFRALSAREPANRDHLLGMAHACAWAGAHADARVWYARALALRADDAEARAGDAVSAQALAETSDLSALDRCPVPGREGRPAALPKIASESAVVQAPVAVGECGGAVVPPPAPATRLTFEDLIRERQRRRAEAPEDGANLVALADLQARAGHAPAAAESLGEAVRLTPDDARLRLRLALLLYRAGDYGASAGHLRAVREAMPARPCLDLYLGSALAWSDGSDRAEAAAAYRRFVERRPDAASLWRTIARLHQEAGELDPAIDAWRRAAASGDPQAKRGLALALAAAGRLADPGVTVEDRAVLQVLVGQLPSPNARRVLERFLEAHPDDDALRLELARALARSGEPDAAFAHFRAWLRRHPDDAAVALEVVGVLTSHAAWDAALAVLDEALARRPEDAALRKARADVLWWRGVDLARHRDEIAAAWTAHLAAHPDDGPTRVALARLEGDRGDWAAVDRRLAAHRADHPFDHAAARLHGEALFHLGRHGEAAPLLEQAARRAPDDVALADVLARALHAAGRSPDAVVARLQSRTLARDERLVLARLLVSLNRTAEAVPVFESALAEAPSDAPARLELAWALIATKRTDRARDVLRALVEASPALLEARLALANASDDAEAAEHFQQYLASRPDALDVRLALGDVLARQKLAEPALAEYRRVLDGGAPDLQRRARLAAARALIAADRAEEAGALLAAVTDPEARLVQAEAFVAAGDPAGARAALEAVPSAQARRMADELDRALGPRASPSFWVHGDSDDLVEWGTRVEGAQRLGDFRTTVGARYALAAVSREGTLHALQGFGAYRLRRDLELEAAAGADVVGEAAVADVGLRLRYDGRAFFASYEGARRALYRDVRAAAVLDAGDVGLWNGVQAGWRNEQFRLEAHYRNGLLSDDNVAHLFGISARWLSPSGLEAGLLVDVPTWRSPSLDFWTPREAVHPRALLRYATRGAVSAAIEGTLGLFHEGARAAADAEGAAVFTDDGGNVLTWSLAPGVRAEVTRGLTLAADLSLSQSGPGLTTAQYRSAQLLLGAEVAW